MFDLFYFPKKRANGKTRRRRREGEEREREREKRERFLVLSSFLTLSSFEETCLLSLLGL